MFPNVRSAPLVVATGLILVMSNAGCGSAASSGEARHDGVLGEMRTSYDNHFGRKRPDRVVITYPDSAAALPELKRAEFDLLRDVLTERGIPFETRRLSDSLTKVQDGTREFTAFVVPEAAARGSTVLFLNLDAVDVPSVVKHPDAREREITVRIWNDPIRISTVRG